MVWRDVALAAGTVGAFPPVLRQDRQLADDLRQFAVARAVEGEGHFALAGFLRLHHMAVIGAELRAVLLEGVEREDDVFGRDRLAVVPARVGAQPIGDRRKIVRMADRFGQQTIFGGNFVQRRGRQRLGEQLGAHGEAALHARRDHVEIVEGAERDLSHRAALRRSRIDVVEMLEARRIFDVAEQRQSRASMVAACAAAGTGSDPAPSAPRAGAASVAAVTRRTDRRVNFMPAVSGSKTIQDAIAGDYVGFSVRHQRLGAAPAAALSHLRGQTPQPAFV